MDVQLVSIIAIIELEHMVATLIVIIRVVKRGQDFQQVGILHVHLLQAMVIIDNVEVE